MLAFTSVIVACSDAGITDPSDASRRKGSTPPVTDPSPLPDPSSPTPTSSPIAGATFCVNPFSNARQTANAWRTSRPADALQMDKVASQAQARWIGNWNADVQADVNAATSQMSASGALPLFVAYNIPQRDCGGLSGGNTTNCGRVAGRGSRRLPPESARVARS